MLFYLSGHGGELAYIILPLIILSPLIIVGLFFLFIDSHFKKEERRANFKREEHLSNNKKD